MEESERKEIFNIFCEANNLNKKLEESHSLTTRRKLTQEQVFMVLANYNNGNRIIPKKRLANKFGIKSPYTISLIEKRETYKD